MRYRLPRKAVFRAERSARKCFSDRKVARKGTVSPLRAYGARKKLDGNRDSDGKVEFRAVFLPENLVFQLISLLEQNLLLENAIRKCVVDGVQACFASRTVC